MCLLLFALFDAFTYIAIVEQLILIESNAIIANKHLSRLCRICLQIRSFTSFMLIEKKSYEHEKRMMIVYGIGNKNSIELFAYCYRRVVHSSV